jgi:alkylation response protein AidB-like acyl-CoA dehydrogenase
MNPRPKTDEGRMEFQLSKSQKEIQKAVREFTKGEFDKESAQEMDKTGEFPIQIWQKAADLGFIGIHFPEELGGGGMGVFENTLIAEEFCKKDSTFGAAIMFSCFAAEYLLRFGTDQQKQTFLPDVIEGRMLSGAAFFGADGRSGSMGNGVSALKTKEGWQLSGEIDYVINGGKAGFYCVLCSHEDAQNQTKSLNMVIIGDAFDGVNFEKNNDKLGLRMTPTARMILEDVTIAPEGLIGKENQGEKQAERILAEAWVLISALAVGTAQGALGRSLDYVKEREQFGKKIARFQVTQHKLAEMATQIEQARYLSYVAAKSFDNRKPDYRLAAMAKLSATRTAVAVASEAIQLLGGYGYMTEYDVERFYRDAKTLELIGGNTVNLKNVIAKNIMGRIK